MNWMLFTIFYRFVLFYKVVIQFIKYEANGSNYEMPDDASRMNNVLQQYNTVQKSNTEFNPLEIDQKVHF